MFTLAVYNEYDQLHEVIVCRPRGATADKPLSAVEQHFMQNDPPMIQHLMSEHESWVGALTAAGAKPLYLNPSETYAHQVYTRDVGFVIGDRLFLGNIVEPVRQPEMQVFRQRLEEMDVPFHGIPKGSIEGGDVLVHAPYVYVGVSERTNDEGIAQLAAMLGRAWQVVPVRIASDVVHLDCVFTIIGESSMIWCPELIVDQHTRLQERFPTHIAISPSQYLNMAANVLVVGPGVICVEAGQVTLQATLREHGFDVRPVDWSQLKKLGGLFRCASCPLVRASA